MKDHGDRHAGRCIARLFADQFAAIATTYDAVIAVPPHPERARKRGHAVAGWLAAALSSSGAVPMPRAVLQWAGARVPQRSLSGQTRRSNARGAFIAAPHEARALRAVLVVDDVRTTGSTLAEARRCLLEAGVRRVDLAVLACADRLLIEPACQAEQPSHPSRTPER